MSRFPMQTAALAVAVLALSPALAEDFGPPARPSSIFTRDYGGTLWRDASGVISSPGRWEASDWWIAGGVAATTGALMYYDKRISDSSQENNGSTMDHLTKQWQNLGATDSFVILGGFAVAGEVFGDRRAEAVTQDAIPTMLFTGLVVSGMKWAVGRERPSQSTDVDSYKPFAGNSSFPSGHTANAFALASAIACNYDDLWVKVGAYTVATGVGVSRVYQHKHYASDVFLGAAIGTFIGCTVHKLNTPDRDAPGAPVRETGPVTRWEPWYDGEHYGLAWTRRF